MTQSRAGQMRAAAEIWELSFVIGLLRSGFPRSPKTQALPLLDGIPLLQGPRGRPRCHSDSVLGDRAYDAERIRRALRSRQILPRLAMRNTKHGSGLGRLRWVVGT
jgi:hypothetical protein